MQKVTQFEGVSKGPAPCAVLRAVAPDRSLAEWSVRQAAAGFRPWPALAVALPLERLRRELGTLGLGDLACVVRRAPRGRAWLVRAAIEESFGGRVIECAFRLSEGSL